MGVKSLPSRSISCQQRRTGAAWLEILLALAFLALFFQVFPSLWKPLWSAIDVRRWSGRDWMVINVIVLLVLFGIRLGPNAIPNLREWWKRLISIRKKSASETTSSSIDSDYEARLRRDVEWAKRAKKRRPWQ